MKFPYLSVGCIAFFTLLSCSTPKAPNLTSSTDYINIHLVSKDPVRIYISQLKIRECEEIKIYPVQGLSLTNIGMVQILKHHILITDRITQGVFIFDRSGNFINTIKPNVNKVDGQIFIGRSATNSNRIAILNKNTSVLKMYNFAGDSITSIQSKADYMDLINLDSLSYIEYYPQPINILNKGFAFREVSLINAHTKTLLRNPILDLNKYISYFYIRSYRDSLSYWEYRTNYLCHISKSGEINKKYKFELGPEQLDYNKVTSINSLNHETIKSLSLTRIIESKNHIYMETVDHKYVIFLFYDKDSKQLVRLMESETNLPGIAIIDDMFNGPAFIPYDITNDGDFFSLERMAKKITANKSKLLSSTPFDNSKKPIDKSYALIRIMKY